MLRFLLLVAIAVALAYPAFLVAYRRAGRSRQQRRRLLAGNLAALALGLILALWLPTRIPETSGSPASLVAILLLWIVGGGLALLGLAAALGAFFARALVSDAGAQAQPTRPS
jgi:hypothetical protein